MAKYRARRCPHCSYFVAFSVSKPLAHTKEVGVTSFCLNCSYRLPIHTILHGIRRVTSHFRRAPLKLASNLQPDRHGGPPDHETNPESQSGNRMFSHEDPSGHLRTLGQQLQQLRIDTFNLECTADGYSIWSPDHNLPRSSRSFFIFGVGPLEKWWGVKAQARGGYAATAARTARRLDYSVKELARMESRARVNRGQMSGYVDGHSLSQLLRTIGSLVYQRNHRLLGISWRDSVCIVVENAQGKREIDVFRADHLYDIWVRMYLRRDNRALSDVPH